MFELHLLESGISGYWHTWNVQETLAFELHLLESGISGLSEDWKGWVVRSV